MKCTLEISGFPLVYFVFVPVDLITSYAGGFALKLGYSYVHVKDFS